MRNKICNDPILPSNECDFAIKLQMVQKTWMSSSFLFSCVCSCNASGHLVAVALLRGNGPICVFLPLFSTVSDKAAHCAQTRPSQGYTGGLFFLLFFLTPPQKGRQSAAHSCIHSLLIHSQGFLLRLNKATTQLRGCTVGAFCVFFYVLCIFYYYFLMLLPSWRLQ